jgi:hypothetical protein
MSDEPPRSFDSPLSNAVPVLPQAGFQDGFHHHFLDLLLEPPLGQRSQLGWETVASQTGIRRRL